MLRKIKFMAVAVSDLEEAMKLYQNLFGLKPMSEIVETRWGFRNVMLGDGQEALVELQQPQDQNGALARFMREHVGPGNPDGQGVYLVAFESDNLAEDIARIKANGGRVNTDGEPPNVAWVHPLSLRNVFIEITQAQQKA